MTIHWFRYLVFFPILSNLFFLFPLFSESLVLIKGGKLAPLYGLPEGKTFINVSDFYIDPYPVTNELFFEFVKKKTDFQKKKISKLYADCEYLKHWDPYPLEKQMKSPVVYVSWFAADEYCRSKGGRLPTIFEWEYVAQASETKKEGSKDERFLKKILEWYSKPTVAEMRAVGKEKPNFWGIYDLHGLIWEWTEDFNSVFVTSDNRQDKDQLKALFCGATGVGADRLNYAAFMRYALRNSLRGDYTLPNLGFRCAYSISGEKK